jgi:hypothetical protein
MRSGDRLSLAPAADSNVLMPPDYLGRLFGEHDPVARRTDRLSKAANALQSCGAACSMRIGEIAVGRSDDAPTGV